jgi:hypothetical protein
MKSVDWFRVVTDLQRAGVPMKEVARRMDIKLSEAMLRAYRAGSEPLYVRGEALIMFWVQHTGKSREQLPMRDWHPPVRPSQSRRSVRRAA